MFTCIGTEIQQTLRWFYNRNQNQQIGVYTISPGDTFPRNVTLQNLQTEALVEILSAEQNPNNLGVANFTSTLTIDTQALKNLDINNIRCGTFSVFDDVDFPNLVPRG